MAKSQGKPASKPGSGDTSGDWYVFETLAADGTFAVGIREGEHDPTEVMLIADRLSHAEAVRRAKRHADEYRRESGTTPQITGL